MVVWQSQEAEAFVGADGLIDPARLAAATDGASATARHDALHDGVPLSDRSFRLPFADPATTRATLPALSAAMQLLQAAPGQRVLDYGCGNGWLSRLLAQQGLEVTGLDPSQRAIDKGLAFLAVHQPQLAKLVRLSRLDGPRLPLPDQSVDRVIAFQSLHQVADQAALLREMFRVLTEGGIAVLVAEAAGHSRAPGAQARMRAAGLAEHEVPLEDLWQAAREAGFTGGQVLPVMAELAPLDIEAFNRAGSGEPLPGALAASVQQAIGKGTRCISLTRPFGTPDSREIAAAKAEGKPLAALSLTAASIRNERLALTVAVRNLGGHRWLPGGSGPGGVNLGVGRVTEGGTERDYRRVRLSQHEVAPGEALQVEFELDRHNATGWVIDLVAEGVTWFDVPLQIDAAGRIAKAG
ncbi:class I SAM-dependent methyltransferase [Roseomonas elaeocarpi]|uniref:Class I SAM-dependent methyltransferase n=1 Tax=Roseomonas elaeocarpi TaxID=907779 RepID=A0ABV6JXZ9_9PROT